MSSQTPPHSIARPARHSAGFTLIELLVAISILSVVSVTLLLVMLSATRSKTAISNNIASTQATRASLELVTRDLRSAGYSVDRGYAPLPQPAIAYVDSMQILINANLQPYPDTTAVRMPPQAYDPAGVPKPRPLDGTSWQPPIKYKTGAEVIRWTLDLNNDGVVDANDIADPNGVDAQATPNPNDYMLARQVYGDSTALTAGFNGGAIERVALVKKPGGAVPPLFTVYMQGSSTPWNWASGPVPANQLNQIERVVVQLSATSPRPDWRGHYAETSLRTEVNSLRNSPNAGPTEYAVNGFVYWDKNSNHVKDGEPGLEGAQVTLGSSLSAITDANGFFQIMAPNGTYVLRHVPLTDYGAFDNPDSFFVTIAGAATTQSFADTARSGGWVKPQVFYDNDKDGNWDGDELAAEGVEAYLGADPTTIESTNQLGEAMLFSQVGGYALYVVPPDSFATSIAMPVLGVMGNGQTKAHKVGLTLANFGTIEGMVYADDNLDGVRQMNEKGVGNVWVGVTLGGGPVVAWTYTAGDGTYSLTVPVNDPPHTTPYIAFIQPPPGSPGVITPVDSLYIQDGQTLSGVNFGLGTFFIITAEADRVLSVASGNLYENDWSAGIPRRDLDIVLGAEASGVDNVMVWFNQFDNTKPFDQDPSYSRDAPHSVLSIAMDSLDTAKPVSRLDVVTGTRYTPEGNFFVWLTQNTSGNEGYLPVTFSPGLNYTTADNGDVVTVLTRDLVGNSAPDIMVGTRGPVSGQGIIEVWENSGTATPTFTRNASYPPGGNLPGGLGEVNAMALGDLDKDGQLDLVVGTRTYDWGGQLVFFEQQALDKKWKFQSGYPLVGDLISSLAVVDVNQDGWLDVVTGTQSSLTTGKLQYWRNEKTGTLAFSLQKQVAAPGQVMCMTAADISGIGKKDLIVGWRESNNNYKGGVELWYTSTGTLPDGGFDPSGGKVNNFVTSITTGNYNYGVYPSIPNPPYLVDFAIGVKKNATQGELVVFIR